ncbi:MAG: hypothetical protein C0456_13815 [Hyphomonas sp.]|uniref:helix-turn-helix transcriptional regulator n=1 Tax=Hyphomonas sp. TaxID=87 RepID=UPI001D1CB161|nr:helix-turn-helix domain-containing protein [Hyphomonas sp.]MBA4227700.1 hypothetical protein [Hyphomonas sp.]
MQEQNAPQEGGTEPLLSTEEAAALAGLSRHTIKNYRSSGSGPPFVRLKGGRVAYRRRDVLAWLAEQPAEDADLVDTVEAARIARLSTKHLENLRCYGAGPPFVRMKGQRGKTAVFYRRDDVVAWRDAR